MKTIQITQGDLYVSTASEIYINWSKLTPGQWLFNLYEPKNYLYEIIEAGENQITVKAHKENLHFAYEKRIEKTDFKQNYHWYFLNKGDYLYDKSAKEDPT